jgi:pimeloyl-ACP methyl ester carboxylesterase
MWTETGVIDTLSKQYRVIALDCRGRGKSDKPHDPAAYGAHLGDDVVKLLDHLGLQRAHVVGYSMGARIASWLIVNHPDRLISATLGASTYYVDSPDERRSFEVEARELEAESPAQRAERTKRENPGMTDAQVSEFIASRAQMNDSRAIAASVRAQPGLFIAESALAATKVPLLHIIGSLDTSRLPTSRRLKDKVLPRVEFRIVGVPRIPGPRASFVARSSWRQSRSFWPVTGLVRSSRRCY